MSKAIGVNIDGVIGWHAPNAGYMDYDTLCGIDAYDEPIGHLGTVNPKRRQKIDCELCKAIFDGFRDLKLRGSDFA